MNDFKNAFLMTTVVLGMAAFAGCSRMMQQAGALAPPDGAIVLFDGTDFSQWTHHDGGPVEWKLVDGAMEVVPGKGSIITKQTFQDFKLHVEFNVPKLPPEVKGQKRGNSGVYLQRRYEVQILDSYGLESKSNDCGALYKLRVPDKNVCKKPGEWQSYDITFHTPRFEGEGANLKKVENARITVVHNGVVIHDNVELPRKTGAGRPEGPEPGPVLLQDHKNKVRFRNIRIIPLTIRAEEDVFRLGMIGLDTSHVTAFTELLHDPNNNSGCRVVAGYPGGSPDMEISVRYLKELTERLRDEFGVEIVDTIEELCQKVDGVMLMSVDGRPHLEQIKPVIAAKKPVYIDKPMAGNLSDVIEIFGLARENNVPCWSSSSLRYCPGIAAMRNNKDVGDVVGCDAFSPCPLDKHHPDLYWYGMHGVEILYTIMGPGCENVRRVQTKDSEFAVGVWKDGRIGTFRGLRSGKIDYGAFVYGTKRIVPSGRFTGYDGLVEQIAKFFRTLQVPVPEAETIEIYAFMSAAEESKAKGGAAVSIKSVIEEAKSKNEKRARKKPKG